MASAVSPSPGVMTMTLYASGNTYAAPSHQRVFRALVQETIPCAGRRSPTHSITHAALICQADSTTTTSMQSCTEPTAFSIRRADWTCDRDALRLVRSLVFIQEQAIPAELEWDEEDAHAIHLLALDSASQPIGTTRITNLGQIGRMAVLPAWRNRGVGSALLREILDIARVCDHQAPFLSAQISALPFYLHAGFETVGDMFLEAGIPHRRMVRHE